MACTPASGGVRCTITSTRTSGRHLTGRFASAYDGRSSPVDGIPGMDGVILTRADGNTVDATFTRRGTPVFAYHATQTDDGQTLTVTSVDPVTRAPLHSVVVYDRVRTGSGSP